MSNNVSLNHSIEDTFKILIDEVQDYARQWVKHEKEDVHTILEWIKAVRSLIKIYKSELRI